MTQNELTQAIAAGTGESQTTVERVLKHLALAAQDTLKTGGEITLPGIGKLKLTQRPARVGRNPRTGDKIEIAASNKVSFTAAKALKDAVN